MIIGVEKISTQGDRIHTYWTLMKTTILLEMNTIPNSQITTQLNQNKNINNNVLPTQIMIIKQLVKSIKD